ncbi:hypothetical protein AB837_00312 [bacterium AB1]|nr:hypothetical protein AB837_00312 [bacterium AB1]
MNNIIKKFKEIYHSDTIKQIATISKQQIFLFIYYFLFLFTFKILVNFKYTYEVKCFLKIIVEYRIMTKFGDILRYGVGQTVEIIAASDIYSAKEKIRENELISMQKIFGIALYKTIVISLITAAFILLILLITTKYTLYIFGSKTINIKKLFTLTFFSILIKILFIIGGNLRNINDALSKNSFLYWGVISTMIQIMFPLVSYWALVKNGFIVTLEKYFVINFIAAIISVAINYLASYTNLKKFIMPKKVELKSIVSEIIPLLSGSILRSIFKLNYVEIVFSLCSLVYKIDLPLIQISFIYDIYKFFIGSFEMPSDIVMKVTASKSRSNKHLFLSTLLTLPISFLIYVIILKMFLYFQINNMQYLFYTKEKIPVSTYILFLISVPLSALSKPFEYLNFLNKRNKYYTLNQVMSILCAMLSIMYIIFFQLSSNYLNILGLSLIIQNISYFIFSIIATKMQDKEKSMPTLYILLSMFCIVIISCISWFILSKNLYLYKN